MQAKLGAAPPVRTDVPLLTFRVGDLRLALPLSTICGLAEPRPIRRVHGAPAAVVGLTEWRGELVTVIDLRTLLDAPPDGVPACLLRLAPPYEHVALQLPELGRIERADDVPGEDWTRLEPEALLRAVAFAVDRG